MARYIQKGDNIDYVNGGNTVIHAGDVVDLNSRIGIAGTEISPGTKGTVVLTGVWEMEKTAALAIAGGDVVYWSSASGKITKTNTDVPAGTAIESADADSTVVLVRLIG